MTVTNLQKDFVISRTFDAPRDLIWKVHTDCTHIKHWWGPKGFKTTYCKIDPKAGGLFHYCLEAPNGSEMWGKFKFREVVPQEKLVYIMSFSDKDLGTTRHPLSATWPLEMHTVVTFEETGGKTKMTVTWSAHNATKEEQDTFDSSFDGMKQGWTGTIEQLEAYLATLR